MTLLEQLKEYDKEMELEGVMDWELKEEIKKLENIKDIFKRLKEMEYND